MIFINIACLEISASFWDKIFQNKSPRFRGLPQFQALKKFQLN